MDAIPIDIGLQWTHQTCLNHWKRFWMVIQRSEITCLSRWSIFVVSLDVSLQNWHVIPQRVFCFHKYCPNFSLGSQHTWIFKLSGFPLKLTSIISSKYKICVQNTSTTSSPGSQTVCQNHSIKTLSNVYIIYR